MGPREVGNVLKHLETIRLKRERVVATDLDGLPPGRYVLEARDARGETRASREVELVRQFLFRQDLVLEAAPGAEAEEGAAAPPSAVVRGASWRRSAQRWET